MAIPPEFAKYGVSGLQYPYPEYRAVPIEQTCWYCLHAQHPDPEVEQDFPRAVSCRAHHPKLPITIGGDNPDDFDDMRPNFPTVPDGIWAWCSQWRKSDKTVPPVPDWEFQIPD